MKATVYIDLLASGLCTICVVVVVLLLHTTTDASALPLNCQRSIFERPACGMHRRAH